MPDLPVAPRDRAQDVLCIGTALIDHLSQTSFALVEQLGLHLGTMSLIDARRREEISVLLGPGETRSGGAEANTAVGIASLGGRALYLGAVADDALGARYEEDLLAAEVGVVLQRQDFGDAEGTGVCYVCITPDAERTMATCLGVSGRLRAVQVSQALVGSASLVYMDGYLLDFAESDALLEALVEARSVTGTLLVVGLADPSVVDRHRSRLAELVRKADIVLCNESEALALSEVKDHVLALANLSQCAPIVVMTRGEKGASIAAGNQVIAIDAAPVKEVRDLTGAGDLFAAGFCFGFTQGYDLARAGRLGALCAAESISHVGARPETSLRRLAERAGI